jgi:hypothetical protein
VDKNLSALIRDLEEGDVGRRLVVVSRADDHYVITLEPTYGEREKLWTTYEFHATPRDIDELTTAADRAGVPPNYGDTATVQNGRVVDFGR